MPNNLLIQLVLQNGHLWGEKEIAIPASDIEQIAVDGTIQLDLDREDIDRFPAVELH